MDGRLSIRDEMAGMIGVDNGGDGQIVAENKGSIVVKWPGHKYWIGHNMDWEYAPVRTEVFTKTAEETDDGSSRIVTVESVISWRNRKPRQST